MESDPKDRAAIEAWFREKFNEDGRPTEGPEFEQTVKGAEVFVQLNARRSETPAVTLERLYQERLAHYMNPNAKEWDGQVTAMDQPAGLTQVWQSALVSPLGPCVSIQQRMLASGITAILWRPEDNTGEMLYVSTAQLDAANQWIRANIASA